MLLHLSALDPPAKSSCSQLSWQPVSTFVTHACPVQEVFPAFFARVLALRLPESQQALAQHEQTAYLLFMINAFQSLEDEMVRAQVRLGAALTHCESMFRVWNMQVSEVGWQL
jgi:hypothetical protein